MTVPQTSNVRVSVPRVDIGLLVIRFALGGLMLFLHGWAKLLRALDYAVRGASWPFVDVVAALGFPIAGAFAVASAIAESVGATLLVVGLFARAAAMVLATNMAVALYSEASNGDPIVLPALYFVGFAALLITGPGRYSVDTWRRH